MGWVRLQIAPGMNMDVQVRLRPLLVEPLGSAKLIRARGWGWARATRWWLTRSVLMLWARVGWHRESPYAIAHRGAQAALARFWEGVGALPPEGDTSDQTATNLLFYATAEGLVVVGEYLRINYRPAERVKHARLVLRHFTSELEVGLQEIAP